MPGGCFSGGSFCSGLATPLSWLCLVDVLVRSLCSGTGYSYKLIMSRGNVFGLVGVFL